MSRLTQSSLEKLQIHHSNSQNKHADVDAEHLPRLKITSLAPSDLTKTLQTSAESHTSLFLDPIYESLSKSWMLPLGPEVKGRTRVQLDKSIRRVATQFYHSTYGLQPASASKSYVGETEAVRTHDENLVLPIRGKGAVGRFGVSRTSLPSYNALITHSSATTPTSSASPQNLEGSQNSKMKEVKGDASHHESISLQSLKTVTPSVQFDSSSSPLKRLASQWSPQEDQNQSSHEVGMRLKNARVEDLSQENSSKRRKHSHNVSLPGPSQSSLLSQPSQFSQPSLSQTTMSTQSTQPTRLTESSEILPSSQLAAPSQETQQSPSQATERRKKPKKEKKKKKKKQAVPGFQ